MQYFVVMIDYGRRGREAVVDPEITRREVIYRIASGEYRNISFVHEITDCSVEDITAEILSETALPDTARRAPICKPASSITSATCTSTSGRDPLRSHYSLKTL